MSRSRSRLACAAALLVLGVSTDRRPARADDADGDDEENLEGYQSFESRALAKTWRLAGRAAIPAVMYGLCSDDESSNDAAKHVLAAWGPSAVDPLLDAIANGARRHALQTPCAETAQQALSDLLCFGGRTASIADYEFGDPPEDDADVARASAQVTRNARPVAAALASKRPAIAHAALETLGRLAGQAICPNRGIVYARMAAGLVAVLDATRGAIAQDLQSALSGAGPAAAAGVPRLTAMLDDPRRQGVAAELLGAIGPASAPATPRLRAMLRGKYAATAAVALGQIGAPARAALPDLIGMLAEAQRHRCERPVSILALGHAIGRLGGASDAGAASAAATLAASLRACPKYEEAIVQALGELGPRGSPAMPALVAILTDEARALPRRELAAQSIVRLGVRIIEDDRAIIAALDTKRRLATSPVSMQHWDGVRRSQNPADLLDVSHQRAAERAARQVDICRQEIGRRTSLDEFGPSAVEGDVAALDRLSDCLEDRLCGPTARSYGASMTACCRTAFGDGAPAWCSGK